MNTSSFNPTMALPPRFSGIYTLKGMSTLDGKDERDDSYITSFFLEGPQQKAILTQRIREHDNLAKGVAPETEQLTMLALIGDQLIGITKPEVLEVLPLLKNKPEPETLTKYIEGKKPTEIILNTATDLLPDIFRNVFKDNKNFAEFSAKLLAALEEHKKG